MTFADELRRWRLEMRLTQYEAADTLLVARRTYEAWETGENVPSQATHFRKLMARELAQKQST